MQAMILFSVVGMLMAVIASLISGSAQQRQAYDQMTRAEVAQYFRDIAKVVQQDDIMRNMSVGSSTTCGADIYTNTDIQPYLCRTNIAQLATWGQSDSGRRDPWYNEIQGMVKTARVAMYAGGSNAFEVPVTVMVLASPGPDRKFGLTTTATGSREVGVVLNDYRAQPASASLLRDLQRIEVSRTAVNPDGSDNLDGRDDVVYVFSTRSAMEQRWARINQAMLTVADAALRHYNQQFLAFQTGLDTYYMSNIGSFYDGAGNIVLSQNALNNWRGAGASNRPAFSSTMFENTQAGQDARAALGVEDAFNLIETASNMRLNGSATSSDQLVLSLTNNGSPWGNAAGQLTFTNSYSTY